FADRAGCGTPVASYGPAFRRGPFMPSSPSSTARCLDALFRYELAAARCYQFAERVLPADRDALAAVRRSHELAAVALGQHLVALGQPPSAGPGLWGVLGTLLEASTASGRWAVL